jgi:nitroreductase
MQKPAETQYPIHDLIKQRWSPLAFDSRRVEPAKLGSILEAARWASSCYNEQPWSFIIATKDEPQNYEKLLSCLVEANQNWAKNAPVLMLSVAKLNFTHNDKANKHAWHDVGLAVGNMTIQAQSLGLYVHQMGGFLPDQARSIYQIPTDYEPVAAIALGYLGNINNLAEDLQQREVKPRSRKPLDSFIFAETWGQNFKLS